MRELAGVMTMAASCVTVHMAASLDGFVARKDGNASANRKVPGGTSMAKTTPVVGAAIAVATLLPQLGAAAPKAQIDHVILGIDDLDEGVASFERLTGVRPVYGGKHPRGTHNALVALGDGLYLEIIALQPGASPPGDLAALEGMQSLAPIGWAVSAPDVAELRSALSAAGIAVTEGRPGSRETPSGATLSWHTFGLRDDFEEAPFFIVWSAESPHPSTTSPSGCSLVRWQAAGPHYRVLEQMHEALGLSAQTAEASQPTFRLSLACPKGTVSFESPTDQR
jgi:hypothetical protein